MASSIDLLFGELAIRLGFVTPQQVAECLKIQQSLSEWRPLGIIMAEQGFLTTEQIQTVINIQKRNLEAKILQFRQLRQNNIFGHIAIRLGFATPQQVDEALEVQLTMQDSYSLKLGEIMVKKGYLSEHQVQQILAYQRAQQITCTCGTKYNVVLFNPGSRFFCYQCERELTTPSPPQL